MSMVEVVAAVLLVAGCIFYVTGTVGLLRFPDVLSRLHALTKTDNLGLLLILLGASLLAGEARVWLLLAMVWWLSVLAATVTAHLIARYAHRGDRRGDRRGDEERS